MQDGKHKPFHFRGSCDPVKVSRVRFGRGDDGLEGEMVPMDSEIALSKSYVKLLG